MTNETTIKAVLFCGFHGERKVGPIFDSLALDDRGMKNYEARVLKQIEKEVREQGLRELWNPEDEDGLIASVRFVWKDTGTIFPGDVISDKQVLYDLQLAWEEKHGTNPDAVKTEEPAQEPTLETDLPVMTPGKRQRIGSTPV